MLTLMKDVYHRSMRETFDVTKFKLFIFSMYNRKYLYWQPI